MFSSLFHSHKKETHKNAQQQFLNKPTSIKINSSIIFKDRKKRVDL